MSRRRAAALLAAAAVVALGLGAWWRWGGAPGGGAPATASGSGRAAAPAPGGAPAPLPASIAARAVPRPGELPVLSGLVRDYLTGEPLAGADVLALPEPGGALPAVGGVGPGPGGVSATAGADGRYAFARLAPGWYRLRAASDGYHLPPEQEPTVFVRGTPPPAAADIALVPLGQLSGQVVDDKGAPLAAVEVRCAATEDAPEDAPPGVGRETSGADGRFDLLCFPGEVVVHARKEGWANGRSEPVRLGPAAHTGGVVIVLAAGKTRDWPAPRADDEPPEPARLAGRVVDGAGAPVGAFRVFVARATGDHGRPHPPVARSVVAPDGRFEIGGLWPGRYNVLAAGAAALAPARAPGVELAPGGRTDVGDLALLVAGTVAGRVTEAGSGRPVPGVAVTVSGSLGDVAPFLGDDVFTADDGSYTLAGILPGKRSIEFAHPTYNHVVRTGALVGAAEPMRLDVEMTPRKGPGGTIEYAGIGAVLAMREARLVVDKVLDGAPARAAGLAAGDVVVSIDGRAAAELGFTDAIEALRGIAGTTVRLEIQRAAERFLLDVVRAQLAVAAPADDE